ncbi:HmuY family protein [Flavobacterium sp. xlx-214]|uniref:HmuY family protein n=1 Tax=unclassified Flavobacterium TaxID=196869 RepID=UPI0013D0C57C|nr:MULTISPECIES: HmuY family protein [unclassified Flavobacterium]MBA5793755.1 HmuY family protein [Flavobacterium sp. xlx-221]QMI83224.1 HmuY family protein [Flavobacterium sp. xlx-214]
MKKSIFILAFASFIFASCSDDNTTVDEPVIVKPIESGTVKAAVGGPNQPNQVFVDLSTNTQTGIKRDTWDLGFSTGSDFRVIINGSVKMAVKKLDTNNIDAVQTADATVAVGYTTLSTLGYVDDPTGVLAGSGAGIGTAIAEISATAADNKVYLVNMGFEVGTTTPNVGSVALDGTARGWKKIRIIREGNDYIVDYANLADTTHKTVKISKKADFNFTFLNLTSGQEVSVQPAKKQWDLSFTGFTNYFPSGESNITYYFADFITTNVHGGSSVYMVESSAETIDAEYTAFAKANVLETNFTKSKTDQRVIGDSWRNGGGPSTQPSIKDTRFYILKDTDGNVFKLRFRALTNDAGERGYPVFEYQLLK